MSDCLGSSNPMIFGSGSRAAETLSISAITILLYSGCFANLKIAADKLLKGAAAKTDLNSANDKLKKLKEHIRVLEEKLPNAFNVEAKLKMKQKEDEKIWEGLESEFSSTMTLCDQLTETLQHLQRLADQVQDVGEDKDCFEVEMSASLSALGILNDRLKSHFKRLVSSKTAVRNSDKGLMEPNMEETTKRSFQYEQKSVLRHVDEMGSEIIDIKTNDIFRSQLDIARMSNSLVVMLFYKRHTRSWKIVLPLFADLTDDYCSRFGNKIIFFTVDVKSIRKMFKVKSLPTAVVIKGDDREEVGRVSMVETTIVPTFITRLSKLLDDWIKSYYGAEAEDIFLDDCFFA